MSDLLEQFDLSEEVRDNAVKKPPKISVQPKVLRPIKPTKPGPAYTAGDINQQNSLNIDLKTLKRTDKIRIIAYLEGLGDQVTSGLVYSKATRMPKYKYIYEVYYDKSRGILYNKTTTVGIATVTSDFCIVLSGLPSIDDIKYGKYREINSRISRGRTPATAAPASAAPAPDFTELD